jgi:enterochelin esterase family protein
MFSFVALGQNVSGRYQVTLNLGPGNDQALLLIVNAEGPSLKGSIGPDETHRLFFINGAVKENTLRFNAGGIDTILTLTGNALSGFSSPPGAATKWTMSGTRISDLRPADRFPPLPNEDAASRSPRIIKLREALTQSSAGSEQAFWDEIKREGEPLVEPIPGDATRSLVTFLWHGSATTKNVLLERGRFTRFQPQQNLFAHIEGTDIWFKTLILPSASRFQYALSENDPAATFPRGDGQTKVQHDPLNPKHLPSEAGTPEATWQSLLELPGADKQAWYVKHDDVPKYEEQDATMQSSILGERRDLKVYLPPNYEHMSKPLPVLYMFDGEDPDGLVFASWTLDNLLAAHRIPPVVVVRIVNPSPALREKELGCLPAFADFMSKELVPYMRTHYRVTSDAALTGVGGYSRGGLAAAYVALRHPESFGLVLSQSGAFWWEPGERANIYVEPNWVTQQYVRMPQLPIRFYLEAGLFEVDLQGSGGDILETTRTLRDVLRSKGNVVFYNEFAGDHDYINWRGTFANAMIALYGNNVSEEKGL